VFCALPNAIQHVPTVPTLQFLFPKQNCIWPRIPTDLRSKRDQGYSVHCGRKFHEVIKSAHSKPLLTPCLKTSIWKEEHLLENQEHLLDNIQYLGDVVESRRSRQTQKLETCLEQVIEFYQWPGENCPSLEIYPQQ
jgi:hypothetical protein